MAAFNPWKEGEVTTPKFRDWLDILVANLNANLFTSFGSLTPTDGNFIVGDGTTWVTESGATARASLGLTIGTHVQAWDADLDAIAALASTGIAVRTASNTWAQRSLAAPAAGLSISNSDGVSGNPTFALANDLSALEGLSSTGFAVRTGTDAWAQRTITAGTAITVTNGDGVSGNPSIAVTDAELVAIAGLTSAADRLPYFTGSGTADLATFTSFARSLVDDADALTARATLGAVIGTNVQAWDADLDALAALSSTGLAARTASNTWAQRTITAPAAGISIADGNGVSGNPTLSLANDLSALEGLSSTGIAVRTATDTWAQRTITGTAAEITVTNGNGVSGNPTLSLPTALTFTGKTVTGGTFSSPVINTGTVGTSLNPSSDDGAALGSASASWSDLFLASGALLNFANGNAVVTHSSGILTVSTGDLRVTTAGTNTASAVTVGGTQTLTNKTLTSPTVNAGALSGTFTGAPTLSGAVIFSGGPQFQTANQHFSLYETGAASDAKWWTFASNSGTFQIQSRTDAGVFTANLLQLTRAGALTVTTINGAALSGTFSGSPTFSGNPVFTGVPVIQGTAPFFALIETDAAADNGRWDWIAASEQLRFRAVNDANNASGNYMLVDRTGVTIDTVNFPGTNLQHNGVAVVTISGTQTLTNKSIALGSNTVTGTMAQFNAACTDGDFLTAPTLTSVTISASDWVSSGTFKYWASGKLVFFVAYITSSGSGAGAESVGTIGTAAHRPVGLVTFYGENTNGISTVGTFSIKLFVATDGTITVIGGDSDPPTSGQHSICGQWEIA